VHLKEIHIHGFKSFAEPTTVELGLGLSVFVGPNGAGKSNISDAIRWALGESRTREVRGQRAEDLIFRGSKGRHPAQMGEVALSFSDEDHRLGLPGSEVVLTRRAFRTGDGEIRLNDRPVRLKDVTRLFLGTGLGSMGYAFIAQGQVEAVLTEGPERRRLLVEEAAGALGYRQRRTEALAELAHADQELARVLDDLAIERERARPLIEEVRRLETSEELRRDIFRLEVALAQKRMKDLVRQIRILTTRSERDHAHAAQLGDATEREREWEALLFDARQATELALYELDDNLAGVERLLTRVSTSRESQGDRLAGLGAARSRAEDRLAEVRRRLEGHRKETRELEAALHSLEARIFDFRGTYGDRPPLIDPKSLGALREDLARRQAEARDRLNSAQVRQKAAQVGLEAARTALRAVEAEGRSFVERERAFEAERRNLDSRLDRLRETLESTWGTGRPVRSGPRAVLEAAERGRLQGVVGPLASLLEFDERHAGAIREALGGSFDNIVVETERDAEAGVRFLRENRSGRATFLALDRVKPSPAPAGPRGAEGFLGLATDLVRFARNVAPAVDLVLGRTFVATTLEAARGFSRDQGLRYRWVTLDGDVLSPGGAITGGEREGRDRDLRAEVAALEARREEIERGLRAVTSQIRDLSDRRATLRDEISALEAQEQVAEGEARSSGIILEGLASELAAAEGLTPDALVEWREAEEELVRLTERRAGRAPVTLAAEEEAAALEAELQRIQREMLDMGAQTDAGGRKVEELERDALALRTRRTTLRSLKNALVALDRKVREHRLASEARMSRLEDAWLRAEDELKRLGEERERTRRRIEIELGAAYDEEAPPPPSDAQRELSRMRGTLEALGPVNPQAREEARRSEERLVRLEAKREDVLLTKERLVTLAAEADEELERRWRSTLLEVERHFQELFVELFEGGEARLVATIRGLEIRVTPPGKREADLDMLSGGERSLVALAFLFALSELNPAPFLLLDEVEAALDEANSRRLLSFLDRHRKDRQYLVITHQRMTMEWADVLIGVTMEAAGVSKLVEIRLEEADRGDLEAL